MKPRNKAIKSVVLVLLTAVLWLTIMDVMGILLFLVFDVPRGVPDQILGAFNGMFIGFFYMGPAFKRIHSEYLAEKAKIDDGGPDNAA